VHDLCGYNFVAMAMEPVAHIADTASSGQGFFAILGGAIGSLIGKSHRNMRRWRSAISALARRCLAL
jgi:hypothetical protein